MFPSVSVIIPVYGVEDCLARCLDSVIGQTLHDIEIICVDDGSPDHSIDILNRYARQDERILIIRQANRGLGAARNTGLSRATGHYVTFVDSDDRLGQPEYLECLYREAERTHVPIAATSILKRKGTRKRWTVHYTKEETLTDAAHRMQVCNCPPDFYVWNKLYLRSRLEELDLSFPEGVIFEDVLFTLRALCEMGPMTTVEGIHYDYLVRARSLTKSRNTERKQRDRYRALSMAVSYCDAHRLPLSEKHRSVPVRSKALGPLTLLKLRERDGKRTWYLFDFIPLYSYKL